MTDENATTGSHENGICRACTRNEQDVVLVQNELSIPQNFIRLFAEFEVEPAKLSIVATDDQVIPRWVNVHRRNPAYARSKHFQKLLLG
jgi:hypothetical protein